MILVDTSYWISHFQRADKFLTSLLEEQQVVTHTAVIGEVSLGEIKNRSEVLKYFLLLPKISEAYFEEVLQFIDSHSLHKKGIGWLDVQLLASCFLSGAHLLTHDKQLAKAAKSLGVLAEPNPV